MSVSDGLDNPGTDPKDDAFNRWPFSKRLADTIVGLDTSNGAPVIAIFGKWGYGKSTVLNYIKKELSDNHHEKILLFEFNPWLFTSQEDLINAFLTSLGKLLEQSLGTTKQEIGKLLEKGSGLFGMFPVVGSGASRFAEQIGKSLAADSISERRNRAFKIMQEAARTVVVLIDDLDRLDVDEMLVMLKLVRLNANFPRMVYVLALDDTMAAKAIGAKYQHSDPESGRQFLEKIIQYPFTLPAVGQDRLVRFIVKWAQEICENADIALEADEWESFRRLVRDQIIRRMNTPRQAIRYANALRFALPILRGRVNPFDQMLIEALRIMFPDVYALMRDDVASFTSLSDNETARSSERVVVAKNVMPGAVEEEITPANTLLSELFRAHQRPKSVRLIRYFDRYFTYAIVSDEISESDLLENVLKAPDDDELLPMLEQLGRVDPVSLVRVLSDFRHKLNPKQVSIICRALARCGRLFVSDALTLLTDRDSREASSLPPTSDKLALQAINLLISFLLSVPYDEQSDTQERQQVLLEAIEVSDPVQFAILLKRQLWDLLYPHMGEQKHIWQNFGLTEQPRNAISDECYRSVEKLLARRIRTFATAWPEIILSRDTGLTILDEWFWADRNDFRQWLEDRFTSVPADAAKFLRLLKVYPTGEYAFRLTPVSQVMSPEILVRALTTDVSGESVDVDQNNDHLVKSVVETWRLKHMVGPNAGW
jgi:hypothetical protein